MNTKLLYILVATLGLANCNAPNENSGNSDETASSDTTLSALEENQDLSAAFTESKYFEQWNKNGDDYVTPDEFQSGFFTLIDQNQDGTISSDEWNSGKDRFFGEFELTDYEDEAAWDTNGDEQIQAEEFQEGLEELNYFSEWDGNGDDQLEEQEIAESTFAMWDTDGNGVIEADEYKEWSQKVEPN